MGNDDLLLLLIRVVFLCRSETHQRLQLPHHPDNLLAAMHLDSCICLWAVETFSTNKAIGKARNDHSLSPCSPPFFVIIIIIIIIIIIRGASVGGVGLQLDVVCNRTHTRGQTSRDETRQDDIIESSRVQFPLSSPLLSIEGWMDGWMRMCTFLLVWWWWRSSRFLIKQPNIRWSDSPSLHRTVGFKRKEEKRRNLDRRNGHTDPLTEG